MSYYNLERAMMDKDSITSHNDKRLFIRLFGHLHTNDIKTRLDVGENVDNLFKELCKAIERKSS